MSFPTYKKYKESGVEWLGPLPEGWEVKSAKYIVDCLDGQRVPLNAEQRAQMSGDVPYWGANAIMDYVETSLFDEELVLLGEDGAPFFDRNRAVAFYSTGPVWPNNHIHVLRPRLEGSAKFITHVFNITDYASYVDGSTRDKLTQGELRQIPIPWPPASEQKSIINFLDHETAKIDALVEEQRRLIELLKEKRQAVSSHAVTKGLNPDAPMKDSGIEWLGEVPEHWEVAMLKRSFANVAYGTSSSLEPDGNVAILRMGNIDQGTVLFDDLKYLSEVPVDLLLREGDLLFNRTNSLDLIAKVGLFEGYDEAPTSFASYLVRLRLHQQYLPTYFKYLLNTPGLLGLARANALVAIGQCNLNPTRYGELPVALPPSHEQQQIVDFLNEATSEIDALTREAEKTISLLQERRSALISAAVTGKIDVRGYEAAQTTEAA